MIKAWTDKKTLKRILQLLRDIERNGYDGIGKPEPLRGDLSSYWSRRIDDCNRIVYRIDGDGIRIVQCGSTTEISKNGKKKAERNFALLLPLFYGSDQPIAATDFERRDTLREEVFLCRTPLEAAMVSARSALRKLSSAAALSPASTAALTFLTAVLTADLTALFLSALFADVKILFFADLMFANFFSSHSRIR